MRRGVTLIELAIVLAIITILMGITVASLGAMKSRVSFNAVSNQVVSEIRRTRIEALNKGVYTAFIINTNALPAANAQSWWGIQTTSAFDLATFAGSPSSCNTPPTCVILTQGKLPAGTAGGATSGSFGGTFTGGLPVPFSGVGTSGSCSLCASTPSGWGSVLFAPGGSVKFSTTPTGPGAQFTMTATRDSVASAPRIKTVAIIAKTGLVEVFEK